MKDTIIKIEDSINQVMIELDRKSQLKINKRKDMLKEMRKVQKSLKLLVFAESRDGNYRHVIELDSDDILKSHRSNFDYEFIREVENIFGEVQFRDIQQEGWSVVPELIKDKTFISNLLKLSPYFLETIKNLKDEELTGLFCIDFESGGTCFLRAVVGNHLKVIEENLEQIYSLGITTWQIPMHKLMDYLDKLNEMHLEEEEKKIMVSEWEKNRKKDDTCI